MQKQSHGADTKLYDYYDTTYVECATVYFKYDRDGKRTTRTKKKNKYITELHEIYRTYTHVCCCACRTQFALESDRVRANATIQLADDCPCGNRKETPNNSRSKKNVEGKNIH